MFTGIIEQIAEVVKVEDEGSNLNITLKSNITKELKIDQSVAHNGVCLTVVDINGNNYMVTAIKETLDKSNLGLLKVGSKVNMERCMKLGDRLDGHMVQGHVDQTAKCTEIKEEKTEESNLQNTEIKEENPKLNFGNDDDLDVPTFLRSRKF